MISRLSTASLFACLLVPAAFADGIVGTIVNAPLSATRTMQGARTGINVYLQSEAAPGIEFMDPAVIGHGIPAGGQLEVIMGGDFERDWEVGISQAAIMLVTGAPQQGLPGARVGYEVGEADNENTFVITPTGEAGLPAETLASPAPGAQKDPIRQRGLKVIHIGFQQSAFVNSGATGTVTVRILDADEKVVAEGTGEIDFIPAPVPQILPTNFPQGRRNHSWQRAKPGDVLGATDGTVPVTLMLYAAAPTTDRDAMYAFKDGITGAGVLSTQQLNAMGYAKPAALEAFNGGLIVQDSNGDGALDPAADRIIGGVVGKAPAGATGQELRTPMVDGTLLLSQPTEAIAEKPGKRWGGAIMQLHFTAGSLPGKYRSTLALLNEPDNPEAGIGSSYTYTIVAE